MPKFKEGRSFVAKLLRRKPHARPISSEASSISGTKSVSVGIEAVAEQDDGDGGSSQNSPPRAADDEQAGKDGPVTAADSLWDRAMLRLSGDDQDVLKRVGTEQPDHGGSRVYDGMAQCITKKLEEDARQRKRVTIAGKTFVVRDVLCRMAEWLRRFKEIGDIVVGFDPVHAALPWAAVRFLLEV